MMWKNPQHYCNILNECKFLKTVVDLPVWFATWWEGSESSSRCQEHTVMASLFAWQTTSQQVIQHTSTLCYSVQNEEFNKITYDSTQQQSLSTVETCW